MLEGSVYVLLGRKYQQTHHIVYHVPEACEDQDRARLSTNPCSMIGSAQAQGRHQGGATNVCTAVQYNWKRPGRVDTRA